MSLKEEIDEKYPYLDDDLYTSNMTKELLAKYLDSYLHFLTYLDPSIQVINIILNKQLWFIYCHHEHSKDDVFKKNLVKYLATDRVP